MQHEAFDAKEHPDLYVEYKSLQFSTSQRRRKIHRLGIALLLVGAVVMLVLGVNSFLVGPAMMAGYFLVLWQLSRVGAQHEASYRRLVNTMLAREAGGAVAPTNAAQFGSGKPAPFPEHIGTLNRLKAINYESKNRGLGCGVGYRGIGVELTVYQYGLETGYAKSDPLGERCLRHFDECIQDVLARDGYSGNHARLLNKGFRGSDETGVEFLRAAFVVGTDERPALSVLLLTCWHGQYLKLRLTSPLPPQEAFDAIEGVADLYSSLLWPNRSGTWRRTLPPYSG